MLCINKRMGLVVVVILGILLISYGASVILRIRVSTSSLASPNAKAQFLQSYSSSLQSSTNKTKVITAANYFISNVRINNKSISAYLSDRTRFPFVKDGVLNVKTNMDELTDYKQHLVVLIDYYATSQTIFKRDKTYKTHPVTVEELIKNIDNITIRNFLSQSILSSIQKNIYKPDNKAEEKQIIMQKIAREYGLTGTHDSMHGVLRSIITKKGQLGSTGFSADSLSLIETSIIASELMEQKIVQKKGNGLFYSYSVNEAPDKARPLTTSLANSRTISTSNENCICPDCEEKPQAVTKDGCYVFLGTKEELNNIKNDLANLQKPPSPILAKVDGLAPNCTVIVPNNTSAIVAKNSSDDVLSDSIIYFPQPQKISQPSEAFDYCSQKLSGASCEIDKSQNQPVIKMSGGWGVIFSTPLVLVASDGSQWLVGYSYAKTAQDAAALSTSTTVISPFIVTYLVINPGIVQDVIENTSHTKQIELTKTRLDAYKKLFDQLQELLKDLEKVRAQAGDEAFNQASQWLSYEGGRINMSPKKPDDCKDYEEGGNNQGVNTVRMYAGAADDLKKTAIWAKDNPTDAKKVFQNRENHYEAISNLTKSDGTNPLVTLYDSQGKNFTFKLLNTTTKIDFIGNMVNELAKSMSGIRCQRMVSSSLSQEDVDLIHEFLNNVVIWGKY